MGVSKDMFYDADADEIILFTEITTKNGKKGQSEEIIDEKKAIDTYSKIKESKKVTIEEFYE